MTTAMAATAIHMVLADRQTEIDLGALQGLWTDAQYVRLSAQTNRLIEFTDGVLEVLPMPTDKHQVILLFLYRALFALMEPVGGIVLVAALPLRIRRDKYREPDILLLRDRRDPRRRDGSWLGADLVLEIVSPDNPARDIREKRADYAEAGIPEYWIVNPLDETITMLVLAGAACGEAGVFRRGEAARSALLPGFAVDVAAVFDAE